jgi:hypothetical protein
MQQSTRVLVPLLRDNGRWVAWSEKLSAYLRLQNPALHHYLPKEPDASKSDEVQQDSDCLAYIALHIDNSLAPTIRGCKTAKAAFDALNVKLLQVLEVGRQSCHASSARFHQGSKSITLRDECKVRQIPCVETGRLHYMYSKHTTSSYD